MRGKECAEPVSARAVRSGDRDHALARAAQVIRIGGLARVYKGQERDRVPPGQVPDQTPVADRGPLAGRVRELRCEEEELEADGCVYFLSPLLWVVIGNCFSASCAAWASSGEGAAKP